MKRSRWIGGSVAVISLTLAACGSDGPTTLSEDDFISAMDDVCRDASRALDRLDAEDSSYFDDVLEIIQTSVDDLNELTPPEDLQDDFDDFVENLEDQLSEGENLKEAIDDGDEEAAAELGATLDELTKESNDLADSIGADRCKDVGEGEGDGSDTTDPTSPEDTTANTPLPIDTTPVTNPPVTEPPETQPPVMTDPPAPPPSTGAALDASTIWTAPAGFQWGTLDDLAGTPTPANDPVLGPLLGGYYAGLLESTTGGPNALIYVTQLNQDTDWTPEQLQAYYAFELVADGTDTTTPTLNLPARVLPNAIEGLDAAVFTVPGFGVSVLGPTGADVLGLLDAFAQAQTG